MRRVVHSFVTHLGTTGPKIARALLAASGFALFASCSQLEQPKVEPFYAETVPPPKQELRWNNGKMVKSIDPAKATAAPETDVVRSVFEGLTDLDSATLREEPGVAEKWESSPDHRTWTFRLRKDAHWTNGDRVAAGDFVASWKRMAALQAGSSHEILFRNIAGLAPVKKSGEAPSDFLQNPTPESTITGEMLRRTDITPKSQMTAPAPETRPAASPRSPVQKPETPSVQNPGVEAIDDATLMVRLELPDKDFAKLVAHPLFRPVHPSELKDGPQLDVQSITNGAFRIVKVGDDGVSMERSETYWNRKSVSLERVRFVPTATAEAALKAYKNGELDIITNASFEPLALKLLTPYEDFRRTEHSALNFYEFNTAVEPFSDRRVREALTIAIDRTKLTDGELEGTTRSANAFLPLGDRRKELFAFDVVRARELLEKAGFPNGEGFPPVHLIINRNDAQQRIAKSVARMWRQHLNIETLIDPKEAAEIEPIRQAGEFDLIRRGVVLPTNDELVNIVSIFGSAVKPQPVVVSTDDAKRSEGPAAQTETADPQAELPNALPGDAVGPAKGPAAAEIYTEEEIAFEMKAIPLYFPISYSMVKPYIRGFDVNVLDAHSLREVRIDSTWQPKTSR
jgi:oligopeptide transport system substrate-binding protein